MDGIVSGSNPIPGNEASGSVTALSVAWAGPGLEICLPRSKELYEYFGFNSQSEGAERPGPWRKEL